jgi:tetratricopeptide (TPR) repeat protein
MPAVHTTVRPKVMSGRRLATEEPLGSAMKWVEPPSWHQRLAAIELAKAATKRRPEVAENWSRLATLLMQVRRHGDAAETLFEASKIFADDTPLRLQLAHALKKAGHNAQALKVILTTTDPDREEPARHRLELLAALADGEEREAAAERLFRLDPANQIAVEILAKSARSRGDAEGAISICRNAFAIRPYDSGSRYEFAKALGLGGERVQARELIDLDRDVRITELGVPPGYASADEFASALTGEVESDPTLERDPPGVAIRDGLQTASGLPHVSYGAIQLLLSRIKSVIASTVCHAAHEWLANPPELAALNAWAVIYPSRGRQLSHIHPSGWISGVYFVRAPPANPDDLRAGCLALGAMDAKGEEVAPPWGIREIPATSGRLVLFPSFVPHATVPTGSDELRLSISFDVERQTENGSSPTDSRRSRDAGSDRSRFL